MTPLLPIVVVHDAGRVAGFLGLASTSIVGGRALLVRAIDEQASALWQRRGFIPAKDDPFILFRAVSDIAASSG